MAILAVGVHFIFDLNSALSAGLLAGSVTNTPSLAGLLDLISNSQPEELKEALSSSAVVGYSLAYPMGVLGTMISISMMIKWLKIDFKKEELELQKEVVEQ